MIPISYNIRNLRARKSTTLASAFGIALVVFVLSSSRMLENGLNRTMARAGSDDHAVLLRKGATTELTSLFSQDLLQVIRTKPGVRRGPSGEPLVVGELVVVAPLEREGHPNQLSSVPVRGVPRDVLSVRKDVKIVEGRLLRPGTDEVMIGRSIRDRYAGVALGKSFVLTKQRKATVVGVFVDRGSAFESEIWADIDTVRSSYGRPALVGSVTVALTSAASYPVFKRAVEGDKLSSELMTLRQSEYFSRLSDGLAKFVGGLGGLMTVFLAAAAVIGAAITMYAAVQHRSREIGTLRALGFSRSAIVRSFLTEACLLSLLGGVVGALASIGMGWVELSLTNAKNFSEITFRLEPTPRILASAVLVGGIMGVVGGLFPALRAASISPLDALRE